MFVHTSEFPFGSKRLPKHNLQWLHDVHIKQLRSIDQGRRGGGPLRAPLPVICGMKCHHYHSDRGSSWCARSQCVINLCISIYIVQCSSVYKSMLDGLYPVSQVRADLRLICSRSWLVLCARVQNVSDHQEHYWQLQMVTLTMPLMQFCLLSKQNEMRSIPSQEIDIGRFCCPFLALPVERISMFWVVLQ